MALTTEQKRANAIAKWLKKFSHPTSIPQIFNGTKTSKTFGIAVNFQRLVILANADDEGFCECISCGKVSRWNDNMNGGHFISRSNLATIIEPDNVWPQCTRCNDHLKGNQIPYRVNLVSKVGLERVEELESMKLPSNHIWDRHELAETKVDILKEIKFHEKRAFRHACRRDRQESPGVREQEGRFRKGTL